MVWRDVQIINNYAEVCVKRQKKQLVYDDWKYIGKDIKTNIEKIKPVIAKRVVMSNLEIANNRIMQILSSNGIDENKPFQLLKKAEEIAISKENSGDLIKIAKELIDIQDLRPQRIQISEQHKSIDYTNLIPNKITKTISMSKTLDNSIKDKEQQPSNDDNKQDDDQ